MHVNKVLRSLENQDGTRCVDLFQRPDGSFGYEEYRRDPEDPRGWSATRNFTEARFALQGDAMQSALKQVAWLAGILAQD